VKLSVLKGARSALQAALGVEEQTGKTVGLNQETLMQAMFM